MFFNKTRTNYNQNNYSNMYNQNPMSNQSNNLYPNYEDNRLMLEIKENRRRINNLAKRIIRLENYLRIRDVSEYSIIDDLDDDIK